MFFLETNGMELVLIAQVTVGEAGVWTKPAVPPTPLSLIRRLIRQVALLDNFQFLDIFFLSFFLVQ